MTRPSSWDIADAAAEGLDLCAFLSTCPRIPEPEAEPSEDSPPESVAPFRCIGYDDAGYHFLLGAQRLPYMISRGSFNASKLGELAKPGWWGVAHQAVTKEGGIDVAHAQGVIIDAETERGFFRPESLRGAGVWLDDGKIVINDGARIVDAQGKATPLEEYPGKSIYIRSPLDFGNMQGPISTDEEGALLSELVEAQEWRTPLDPVAVLGWSLMAPFGGVLAWRPNIWPTGPSKIGKSWVMEHIIGELCGPFAHFGNGRETEPGARRNMNLSARPGIFDEMEPRTKAERENIAKLIVLARNATCDSSARLAMASIGDSTTHYFVRGMFCFASINVPTGEGAAVENRWIRPELKVPLDKRAKIDRSTELYAKAMTDPVRYRRRIFRALPRILDDVAAMIESLPVYLGGRREADMWAPLLAAAWAVQSDESIQGDEGMAWLMPLLEGYMGEGRESVEDEDRVIEHILGAQVENEERKRRTVAELLGEAWSNDQAAAATLMRHGIRLRRAGGSWQLCIAKNSDHLRKILQGTPYESGYDAQIRRNSCCLEPEKGGANVSMAGRQTWCQVLDWKRFKDIYLGDAIGVGKLEFEKEERDA